MHGLGKQIKRELYRAERAQNFSNNDLLGNCVSIEYSF